MKQPKIPVKMLTTLTILMVFLCVGSYLLSPKWQAVHAEYQRQRDPLHQFASQQTPEAQLQALQDKIWEMIWRRWCAYEDLCHSR